MSELSYFYWGVYKGDLLVGFFPTEYAAVRFSAAMAGTRVEPVKTAWR